jgi:hypothetical protein
MFEVKSLCSYSCDLAGEERKTKKITNDMRMRNDATECVKEVLKSKIIRSFSLCKVRRICSYLE